MFAKFSRWLLILVVGLMVFNMVGQMAAQDDDTPILGEIELIGTVEAFDDSTVTIAGQVFNIVGTEINVTLAVGQQVKVQGWILPNGSFVAREIEDPLAEDDDNDNSDDNNNDNSDDNSNDNTDDNGNDNTDDVMGEDDDAEIVGVVTEITATTITVGGQVINIEGAEMDDVVVGEVVKVHLLIGADGTWTAREVDNDIDDDDDTTFVPADCVVTAPAGWATYTIQAGDTLSEIANRADTSVASLTRVNCIQDTGLIVAGTTLFVPRTPVASSNDDNDNSDDDSNDNGDDDNGNDNSDDDGNDNGDDSNDNGDDDSGDDNNDDNSGRGGDDDSGDDDDDDSNDND